MSSVWHPTFSPLSLTRIEGIMGCNRCAEEERRNPGGDQSDCNFRHALFSEAARSVRLPDYLHFEKRWQGNCRHVLQSPEVISQHSQRYQNVLKRRADAAWILLRLRRQNNRYSKGPVLETFPGAFVSASHWRLVSRKTMQIAEQNCINPANAALLELRHGQMWPKINGRVESRMKKSPACFYCP